MHYTQAQIDQYWKDYIQSNEKELKERLRFLLDNYNPENKDYLSSPDVYYCFEEARHAFMMGDFVASIIMCAVTIERQLAKLLDLPYRNPVDEETAKTKTGWKILEAAKNKQIIDQDLFEKLVTLFDLRNEFVHGISKENTTDKKGTRPQFKDSIKNAFVWTDPSYAKEIEENAKKAIKILFEAHDKLHYSKLNYY
ncbi:MAG TPA: hypothetical protein PLX79_02835 [Candidatus Dojkabacteria bacterium]|jgi:tRNA uridine 5-carbamoylmethylation protein Kti12|nr:hypothetical protein [Candidatus Dojkabacteria bacterium]